MINNNNFIILFFTSNLGEKYGLELENYEEIKQIKKTNNIIFNFKFLKKIEYIINDLKDKYNNIILYIDYCNSNLNLLLNLNNIINYKFIYLVFKFKGYSLNNDIINIINNFNNKNKILFLTTSNNIIKSEKIKFIKYWRINLNELNIQCDKSLLYEDYLINLNNDKNKYYTFVFIGRKDKFKQICLSIELYEKLFKLNNNIRLIIIGTQKEELFIKDNYNIYNIPFLDNNNCLYILNNFGDCLFLPSLNEGFGRVYVEALYLNKIILITKNSMFSDDINKICPDLIIDPVIKNENDKNKIIEKMNNCIINHYSYLQILKEKLDINIYNKQDLIDVILNNIF